MRTRTKEQAIDALLNMMTEIWQDIRSGKENIYRFSLKKYISKHHIDKFNKDLIMPYIRIDSCPTYEQACALRNQINRACYNIRIKNKK